MAFMIYPTQDICNIFERSSKTVNDLIITDGCVVINDYRLPLHKVLYIKEI